MEVKTEFCTADLEEGVVKTAKAGDAFVECGLEEVGLGYGFEWVSEFMSGNS